MKTADYRLQTENDMHTLRKNDYTLCYSLVWSGNR